MKEGSQSRGLIYRFTAVDVVEGEYELWWAEGLAFGIDMGNGGGEHG